VDIVALHGDPHAPVHVIEVECMGRRFEGFFYQVTGYGDPLCLLIDLHACAVEKLQGFLIFHENTYLFHDLQCFIIN